MPCNDPIAGWKSKDKTARGLRAVTFDLHKGIVDFPINVPCGKCFGCQLAKSREWAIRCSHEAQMHDHNSFITLTYNDKNLPPAAELRPADFVNFMKRLRDRSQKQLSFFHCGEYGELDGRPHHHALLFGRHFPDMTYWRKSGQYNLFRSKELEQIWTNGHSEIGEVSFESAGYIARYQMKGGKHENKIAKPYLTMSRNPAIGKTWLKKYMADVYPGDEIIIKGGQKQKPPRYYDNQLEKLKPKLHAQLRADRIAKLTDENKSGLRFTAREKILRAKAQERKGNL